MARPSSKTPPEVWEPLLRLARLASRPLERFLQIQAASGILLIVSALVALVWANSPWAESYLHLWHTPLGVRVGSFAVERTLEWAVNDGLMVIFFFVVGLEIRREVHHGELSEWRRAALPAAAALGGMVMPAILYLAIAGVPETRSGWGVPMATDIAFAVGILVLLGKRVPPALRVLLLALAVIDDLGAVIVIALFYSSGLDTSGLVLAGAAFAGIVVMQRFGVRARWLYVPPSLVAWAGVMAAGIHPTIAGVIIGLLTPVRAWLGTDGFVAGISGDLKKLAAATPTSLPSEELAAVLNHVDDARREAMSPAEGLIAMLHPWVAFVIMPIFALANAGVVISASDLDAAAGHVIAGVSIGLVVGKPIGVLFAIWLTVRLGLGVLPAGIGPRHLVVLGAVAGVGFTMALFVAKLAFFDPHLLAAAKLGVLIASVAAGVVGVVLGRLLLQPAPLPAAAATSADEAEGSTHA